MRSLFFLRPAALMLTAFIGSGCSDDPTVNPGIECPPRMDGLQCDGGRPPFDAGVFDAGRNGQVLKWGDGALLAISGTEGVVLYDIDADQRVIVKYAKINQCVDGTCMGVPGTTTGLVFSTKRDYLYIAQSGPNQIFFFNMVLSDIVWSYPLSDLAQLSRPVLGPVDSSLYLVSATDKAFYKFDSVGQKFAQRLTAPLALSSAWSVAAGPGGLMVGSTDGGRVLAFNDPNDGGPVAYDPTSSVDLIDGANQGVGPTTCVATQTGAFYCSATGTGAGLWYVKAGTAPKLVVPGVAVGALAISSLGERLWVGTGNSLRGYWIAANPQAPYLLGTLDAGGPVFDIVSSADGQWVFASVPSADVLLKVRAADLKVMRSFKDLQQPRALAFGP